MIVLAGLLLAAGETVVVPSGDDMTAEEKVEILARSITAASTQPVEIFEDPSVRGEMKRVGVDAGCPVVTEIAEATAARFASALTPFAETAVRETIPAQRLESIHPVSFLATPAGIYRGRIEQKFETIASVPLAEARSEAKHAALAVLAALPDFVPGRDAGPPITPVFESALGAKADQTWDRAPLLSLACLQRHVPAGLTFEHDGQTFPQSRNAQ